MDSASAITADIMLEINKTRKSKKFHLLLCYFFVKSIVHTKFFVKMFLSRKVSRKKAGFVYGIPVLLQAAVMSYKGPTCPTTLIYFSICYTQWANKSQIMENCAMLKSTFLNFSQAGSFIRKKKLKNVSVGQKKCILFNSRTFFIISAHNLPIVISFTFLFTLKVSKTMNHAGCRRKKIRGEKY